MDNINETTVQVELAKCANDFVYFCEHYVKVRHPTQGIIPFTLYDFQKRLVNEYFDKHRYVIGTKFRQGGFSTLTIAWTLWKSMFTVKRFLWISNMDRQSMNLSNTIQCMIDDLPDWLRPELVKSNNHAKHFNNGSRVNFLTGEGGCGQSCDYLIFEEAAFQKDMDLIWKRVWPTISAGGSCFVLSTPNGTDNWFHKTYTDAEKHLNAFTIYRCNYREHPDYRNPDWAAECKKNLGPIGWRQEVLCEFIKPKKAVEKVNDTLEYLDTVELASELMEELTETGKEKKMKFIDFMEAERLHRRDRKAGIDLDTFQIKTEHVESGALDWECDNIYESEEAVKERKQKEAENKKPDPPEAHQFAVMTKEEAEAMVKEYLSHAKPVNHARFDDFNPWTVEDLLEFSKGVAEIVNYEDVKNYWLRKHHQKEYARIERDFRLWDHIDCVNDWQHENVKEADLPAGTRIVVHRPERMILKAIKKYFDMPVEMSLSFHRNRLCVNGVPTLLKESELRDLYNGVYYFKGYEEAVAETAKTIAEHLSKLFCNLSSEEELDAELMDG